MEQGCLEVAVQGRRDCGRAAGRSHRLRAAALPEYLRAAARLLAGADRRAIIDHLAAHPAAGDLIAGTGGVRKLRWARDSRGKSGGVRVIYYFHSEAMPLYLLTMFAKNERANLSKD